ncbi:MAG: 16S rRNA processing protein RimM [Coriobacteriia bacterium]|nr:16S rRNA processing protein RimM [Coriobacteriia bacterium]
MLDIHERLKEVAQTIKPHGINGEVLVQATSGLPLLLSEGMEVCVLPPQLDFSRYGTVESVRAFSDKYLLRFSNITSLASAELVCPGKVMIAASLIPDDLKLYHHSDLVGRQVYDENLELSGVIEEILLGPANDVWQISREGEEKLLLPVLDETVLEIPDEGPILIHVLDGLID